MQCWKEGLGWKADQERLRAKGGLKRRKSVLVVYCSRLGGRRLVGNRLLGGGSGRGGNCMGELRALLGCNVVGYCGVLITRVQVM